MQKSIPPILYIGALYASLSTLKLNIKLEKFINILVTSVITIVVIRIIVTIVSYLFEHKFINKEQNENRRYSLKIFLKIINGIIWAIGIFSLLDNVGFKVSTIIASLGIGGIALAFASQTVLGDLFSYFSIFFDKPFEIGDFIVVGDKSGTVENIGIKSTRLRSLSGEQLIFSNTNLTNLIIHNYKRMEQRRVAFKFGVEYETPITNLNDIPKITKNIIENIDGLVFDRANFLSFGDYSLIYEVVYYIKNKDYNKFMIAQEEINLKLKEEFDKRNISFAYPTHSVYINKVE